MARFWTLQAILYIFKGEAFIFGESMYIIIAE